MDLIKENYAEEQPAKKQPLSAAERQRIYRENNPEKSKELQRRYREKTSVKKIKILMDDKNAEIDRLKQEIEQLKDLTRKFLLEKLA